MCEIKACANCINGAFNIIENQFKCFERCQIIPNYHKTTCQRWKTKVITPYVKPSKKNRKGGDK